MASEKQIAANRANAQHSTGPRTAAGKRNSSRNSYHHGLFWPLPPELAIKVKAIARELMPPGASEQELAAAFTFAEAQVGLVRIRGIRTEMQLSLQREGLGTRQLRRLAALDRYERYADTKRRGAMAQLDGWLDRAA
jgi:hypothetical protein